MANNILHVVNSQALGGGIGTVLDYLDQGLNQTGTYQSSILKTNADDIGRDGYEQVEKDGMPGNFIYDQKFLEQEISNYDIIHIHGVPSYRILEAIDSLRKKGYCPKIVNTCHSSVKKEVEAYLETSDETEDVKCLKDMVDYGLMQDPGRFNETYWGSAIYRQEKVMTFADRVQHMNRSYLDEIVSEYSAEENMFKQRVVYNGIDVIPERKITSRPKKKRILYSGRFAIEKGIEELIESLPKILAEHPDAEIKLMGGDKEGKVTNYYKEKTEALFRESFGSQASNYLDKINFTGWLTDKQHIEDCYDWCDFLIAPSKDESFCLAVAEALNHQRIPIMTNTPSLNELYLSNNTGIGIEPENRDAEGIANVVNKALSEIGSIAMSENAREGRKLVTERYSLDAVMDQQIRLYEELLK
ncbi:glycosyltransferase family 4 protein [archaeon]|jgi:glycosyltransferase involved in cell wall biosynthesis|nr:glycosyltransferase family 4 protein [archaeon]MBT3450853.1 glycosyltransferase family 4 protein [archaeon]MBT6868730.1 glycosyltransferase family 4 protein [archaeon]MBT7192355.1 glycosyltransferase family 4 protein [archaeon]MBT7381184.1 glycosyltransferase family 4 protein [archaeon]